MSTITSDIDVLLTIMYLILSLSLEVDSSTMKLCVSCVLLLLVHTEAAKEAQLDGKTLIPLQLTNV